MSYYIESSTINSSETVELDKFVSNHPDGNYFQTNQYIALMAQIKGNSAVILSVKDENNTVYGVLCGILTKEPSLVKSLLSARLIIVGGPLIDSDNTQVLELLLSELEANYKKKAIYIEFRNLFSLNNVKDIFSQHKFYFKPHLNFLVSLDDEKLVKKRMSDSKVRQIKSSLKAGVTFDEARNISEVEDLYRILEKLYKEKVKKPLPVLNLFLSFYAQNHGKIFIVKKGEDIIGGIICPVFKDKSIYEWYVCGLDGQEKGVYPSIVATWAPMEYGLKNGIRCFDFMGAGSPDADYGVREFKEKFGGDLVENGRFIRINKPTLYKIGKLGLKIYSKF